LIKQALKLGDAINDGKTKKAERAHDKMEDIIDDKEDNGRIDEDTAELLFDLLDEIEDAYDL